MESENELVGNSEWASGRMKHEGVGENELLSA